MKRKGNLYHQICEMENLILAEKKARKGKKDQYGVKAFDKNRIPNLLHLQSMLIDRTYKTSEYARFIIYEPKEREIFRLPYFPDRIAHHAVMNIIEKNFVSVFTADTYSCIKGRGIHGAAYAVQRAMRNEQKTKYCLKLDIKKFYPSIDHDILKYLLRKKFKDNNLLWLLDEIIDSAPGVPIGNYLSQYFANFYLTYFDHWIKEELGVEHYYRYADDIVIFSDNKEFLHQALRKIREYLKAHLKLEVKDNYQVFLVSARGVDFVGYRFFHKYILLRKSIKQNFARMLVYRKNAASIASYNGWLSHCNSYNLQKKLLQ
ncbi:MAG: RNA-directed DNA polymerase [Chitinophagales bacterium]